MSDIMDATSIIYTVDPTYTLFNLVYMLYLLKSLFIH